MSKSSLKGGRFADMAFIVVFRVIHSRGVQFDHLIRNTDMNVCVCSFAPVSLLVLVTSAVVHLSPSHGDGDDEFLALLPLELVPIHHSPA